jgi:transglutaminase superfamily protein
MWAQLRRFNALPGAAKADFLRALLLLPLIRTSLRLRGFHKTQKFLHRYAVAPGRAVLSDLEAEAGTKQTCRMVLAASRRLHAPGNCLERSLTLWWLLARHGITSDLRIGARKTGEKFEAHAWVERNGQAVGEPEPTDSHYTAFEREFRGDLP